MSRGLLSGNVVPFKDVFEVQLGTKLIENKHEKDKIDNLNVTSVIFVSLILVILHFNLGLTKAEKRPYDGWKTNSFVQRSGSPENEYVLFSLSLCLATYFLVIRSRSKLELFDFQIF